MTGVPAIAHRLILGAPVRQLLDAAVADPREAVCAQVRAPGGHGKTALLRELG